MNPVRQLLLQPVLFLVPLFGLVGTASAEIICSAQADVFGPSEAHDTRGPVLCSPGSSIAGVSAIAGIRGTGLQPGLI